MLSFQNYVIYLDTTLVIDLPCICCSCYIQEIWNMSCLSVCDIVFYIVYDGVYDVVYDIFVLPVGFYPENDGRRCWRDIIAPWASRWTGHIMTHISIWCRQTCADDHGDSKQRYWAEYCWVQLQSTCPPSQSSQESQIFWKIGANPLCQLSW